MAKTPNPIKLDDVRALIGGEPSPHHLCAALLGLNVHGLLHVEPVLLGLAEIAESQPLDRAFFLRTLAEKEHRTNRFLCDLMTGKLDDL